MAGATGTSIIHNLLARLNLRFPALVAILALLTLLDLIIPDFIPFLDEIVLALLTLLFGMWKKRDHRHETATTSSPKN